MNSRVLFSDDRDLAALVCEATSVAPSSELLDRIHASRADGLRMMLPSGETATPPVSPAGLPSSLNELSAEQLARRVWMIGISVAATLVAAVTALWPQSNDGKSMPAVSRAAAVASAIVDSTVLNSAVHDSLERVSTTAIAGESLSERLSGWPRAAYADTQEKAPRTAPYLGNFNLDALKLRPGRRTYLRSVGNSLHAVLPYSTFTVELDSVRLGGDRAWCLVTVTQTSRGPAENNERDAQHDTVWLRRNDLRPIRRAGHAGFLRMPKQFSDRLLVETDSPVAPQGATMQNRMKLMPFRTGAAKPLDASVPFVPTEETMRLLLRAARLNPTWRSTVGVLSGDKRTFVMGEPDYLNLRVDGSREVQTVSGRYDTWRVVLESGPKPEVWYVSKETGETLLTEGSWGVRYPVSETRLLYGFEETRRRPPAANR